MKPASNAPRAMRPASPTPAALPSSVSASAAGSATPASPSRATPSSATPGTAATSPAAAGPASGDPHARTVMLPMGYYNFPALPSPTTVRRIAVTGRKLNIHPAPEHDLPLRGRQANVLEHVMKLEYEDAPGEPLRGRLRYAWILPPDTPPGLQASLEIDGRVINLGSDCAPSRRGRHAAGTRGSGGWDQAFIEFLLAQGFEPLALTDPASRRGGERSGPVYGYLKMCLAEGEDSSDDEDPRVQARRLPVALAGGSRAVAEPGDRSARAGSARSHQREQKRRAAGTSGAQAASAGEVALRQAATPPSPAARALPHFLPLGTQVSIPVHGRPAPAGPTAEALEPGTAVTIARGDPRRQTFVTSVVTPPDFPSGLTLRLKWGDKTMLITAGADGNLRSLGNAVVSDQGDLGPLDPWRIAELEAEGYVPISVRVPQVGTHATRGAPMKTHTIYIRHRAVDIGEDQGDAGQAEAGGPPAPSRREQAKKARKRAAQRRAKLREPQAQPGTATAAPASQAPSSGSSSSAPAESPDQEDPGSTPG